MAGSLKDQLLKAGLVSAKQVKQSQHQQRKTKGQPNAAQSGTEQQRAQQEKVQRDRELNQRRQQDAERKAVAAQIRQLIETNRVEKIEGETPYNFVDGTKVKRIYVTPEIHTQLVRGTLHIAKLGGRPHLVNVETADKIRQRDPSRVIAPVENQPAAADENDPYAAYQVPDDLMW